MHHVALNIALRTTQLSGIVNAGGNGEAFLSESQHSLQTRVEDVSYAASVTELNLYGELLRQSG